MAPTPPTTRKSTSCSARIRSRQPKSGFVIRTSSLPRGIDERLQNLKALGRSHVQHPADERYVYTVAVVGVARGFQRRVRRVDHALYSIGRWAGYKPAADCKSAPQWGWHNGR